jgi:hypothetical protein
VVFDTGDISDPEPVFEADEVPYIPQTFRGPPFSHYLPPLPAKHTYLCSPPSPPQRSTLSLSVEKKLQNTAQVRNALKSLMDATDEPAEPIIQPPLLHLSLLLHPLQTTRASLKNRRAWPRNNSPSCEHPSNTTTELQIEAGEHRQLARELRDDKKALESYSSLRINHRFKHRVFSEL